MLVPPLPVGQEVAPGRFDRVQVAAGVEEQHPRGRALAGLGAAQQPDVGGPGGDHGPQHARPEQVRPDAAARTARGGGGRHQDGDRAAGPDPGQAVLHPGQLGLAARRQAELPARVGGQLLVSPGPLVEGRVADHRVGAAGQAVGPQRVAGVDGRRDPAHPQPGGGDAGRRPRGVLAARGLGGQQQGAQPAGRVEQHPAAGQAHHQVGEVGRGDRELARVGLGVALAEELEGVEPPALLGQLRDQGGDVGGQRGGTAFEEIARGRHQLALASGHRRWPGAAARPGRRPTARTACRCGAAIPPPRPARTAGCWRCRRRGRGKSS